MDFRTQLIAQKEQLQKQLSAIDILLLTLPTDGQAEQKPESTVQPAKPGLPHEGIIAGKRGDCTTSFIRAGADTEFRGAGFGDV